jgi:hypothetical protein
MGKFLNRGPRGPDEQGYIQIADPNLFISQIISRIVDPRVAENVLLFDGHPDQLPKKAEKRL